MTDQCHQQQQQQQQQLLTSTTAPGKVFSSRSELAEHYKSDWHKYNLKRRQAGLPVLLQADFEARLEAAKALRQEKKVQKFDHLKKNKESNIGKKQHALDVVRQQQQKQQSLEQDNDNDKKSEDNEYKEANTATDVVVPMQQDGDEQQRQQQQEEEAAIEIDPRQCLFDKHLSSCIESNAQRMERKYGFFVPDREYLTDLEGLIGYCHEKIKLGHMCLYCQRVFTTWHGCQKHMLNKNHTKLLYEAGVDLEDLNVFYDFAEADADFLDTTSSEKKKTYEGTVDVETDKGDEKEYDDDGDVVDWEDVSDDEEMEDANVQEVDEEEDDDFYEGYEEQVARMGFDVTPLGELIFPDGRIIGHRTLRRYYKQRAPRSNDNEAVLAARKAAGERLYRGRVYNIGYGGTTNNNSNETSASNALALTQAGISPGLAAGRAGKGILVSSGPGGSFSQLSIYRYRAAIRKQRRGDFKGQRIYNKTNQNINRMDKKHNRLMNNVSVAHAPR